MGPRSEELIGVGRRGDLPARFTVTVVLRFVSSPETRLLHLSSVFRDTAAVAVVRRWPARGVWVQLRTLRRVGKIQYSEWDPMSVLHNYSRVSRDDFSS
eukprot:m.469895 g.469895  ORF g.469895 m.469895 type:complete len:99 (+) comp29208_c0_seq1:305-601(+)